MGSGRDLGRFDAVRPDVKIMRDVVEGLGGR